MCKAIGLYSREIENAATSPLCSRAAGDIDTLFHGQCNCASQLKAGNVAIQLLYLLRIRRTFIEIHLIYTEETLLRSNRAFTNFTARLPIFTAPASTLFFQSMLRLFNWISNCLIFAAIVPRSAILVLYPPTAHCHRLPLLSASTSL